MNNKVAIVNFSDFRLGDILINRDFYRSIKNFHKRELVIFSKEICPIEEVLKFDNLKFISLKNDFSKGFKQFHDYRRFLNQIKEHNIDTIYLFDKNLRPTIFSYFSKIDKLYGFGFGVQKIFLKNKKYLTNNYLKKNKYEILSNFLDKMQIPLTNESIKINEDLEQTNNNNVFINLDSSSKKKNWGDKNFFRLIKKINKINKKIFYINCLNYKSEIFDMLTEQNISFKNVSDAKISNLFKIIKSCEFTITNDTGPAHMSIALNKKTFVIFLEKNKYNYRYSKYMYPIIVNKKDSGQKIVFAHITSKI